MMALGGRVRVSIPLELSAPLIALAAGTLILFVYLWFVRDRRTGWRWYVGNLCAIGAAFLLLVAVMESVPHATYYGALGGATTLACLGVRWLIHEGWRIYPLLATLAFAVGIGVRLFQFRLFEIVDGQGRYVPASHPANVLAIGALVAVVLVYGLALRGRRPVDDIGGGAGLADSLHR